MGIFTGGDLRRVSLAHLTDEFGKMGQVFFDFARGIDHRPVVSEWERKSVSCERTFATDIFTPSAVLVELYHAVLELEQRIAKSQFEGRTLTLKVKYSNFQQITRSVTQQQVLRTKDEMLPIAKRLLAQVTYSREHPIRLLGLGVSGHVSDIDGSALPAQPSWEELELPFEPWPNM